MHQMTVDFSKTTGKVKPMHGIGNAPLCGTDNKMFHYLGEAGFRFPDCMIRADGLAVAALLILTIFSEILRLIPQILRLMILPLLTG